MCMTELKSPVQTEAKSEEELDNQDISEPKKSYFSGRVYQKLGRYLLNGEEK